MSSSSNVQQAFDSLIVDALKAVRGDPPWVAKELEVAANAIYTLCLARQAFLRGANP